MNAVYRATCFAICMALIACGNKGDLELNKIELSAEEKAVLEGNGAQKPVLEGTGTDDSDTDETKPKKPKKKKTDTSPTTE